MRLPGLFASDFTGLVEYFIALILWCIGLICAIVAIAVVCSRNPKLRSGPFAFIAMICSMLILLLVVSVSSHYKRVEWIPLTAGILPGVAGVLCLVCDRRRQK